MIGDKATEMIKTATRHNLKELTVNQKNVVLEFLATMKGVEKLDRPNSLLFKAKL